MSDVESVEYETVTQIWDVGGWVKTAYDFVKFLYDFGKANPVDVALGRITQELQQVQRDLTELNQRLDTVTQRLAKSENSERVRFANLYQLQLETAANRLLTSPSDRVVAANVAFEAGGIADLFLSDEGLWDWTDIRIVHKLDGDGHPAGDPRYFLEPPDFKLAVAFPVYSLALGVWLAGVLIHTDGNKDQIRSVYGDRLDRHIQAVSLRDAWRDDGAHEAVPIDEKIRTRIVCAPVAETKYDESGTCRFTVQCHNTIDRSTSIQSSFSISVPDSPLPTLCTAGPETATLDERDVEDHDPAIQALALWNEILRSVRVSGHLPSDGVIGSFPSTIYTACELYAVNDAGKVLSFQQMVPNDDGSWEGPETLATDWGYQTMVPAGGGGVYVQSIEAVWDWYPSFGASPQLMGTAMDLPSEDPLLLGPSWNYFGGAFGTMYGIITANPRQGDAIGDLYYVRPGRSTRAFTEPKKVGNGWDAFRSVFAMGDGVIYGVFPDGRLRWYRHTGWGDGTASWAEPKDLATDFDWSQFSRIIPVRNGVIYGMYPDGRMVVFLHEDWETGGSTIKGPASVGGDWLPYRVLIADMDTYVTGVA